MKKYLFVFLFSFIGSAIASSDDIALGLNQMTLLNRDHKIGVIDKITRLEEIYKTSFIPHAGNLNELSDSDIKAFFKASDMLSVYEQLRGNSPSLKYLGLMRMSLDVMQSRKIAEKSDREAMLDGYVATRDLRQATSFKRSHPDLSSISVPKIILSNDYNESNLNILSVPKSGNDLKLENFKKSDDIQIVIVSGCHFARDAARQIDKSNDLRTLFLRHNALWIIPAGRDVNISEIQAWNIEFPRQKLHISYDNAQWPNIDFSIIPNFYIYRRGELVDHMQGWNGPGSETKIIEMIGSAERSLSEK